MGQIQSQSFTLKNGQSLILSTPSELDAAELQSIAKLIFERSGQYLLTTAEEFHYTVEQQTKRIQTYWEHPDHLIIVPKIAGKIVGQIGFQIGSRKRNCHQGEFGMSVHPDFQCMGIGHLMLKTMIEWCQDNPRIETLRLKVHSKNTKAIALYKRFHFHEEGREIRGVKFGENNYDDVILMALNVQR